MKIVFVCLVVLVAGCAQAPESVAPAYVSELPYQNLSCDQLAIESARVDAAYERAAAAQRKAQGNDVASVILIGLPVSTLSGANVADQIAQLKGQQETLAKVSLQKKCIKPDQPLTYQLTASG